MTRPLPPHGDVASRLHSAAIHLLRTVRQDDPLLGLSPPRLSALSVLVFGGPRSLGALAAAEQVTPPTMTRLVSALEQEGWVVREPSPDDGRVVIVRATEKAVEGMEAGRRRRVERLLELLSDLSSEDWERMEVVVGVLERVLRSR